MARLPEKNRGATARGGLPGLTLTATPIGNLEDLSPRARRSLEEADVLACEDTRHTGMMLKRLGIAHGKLVAYHDHSRGGVDEGLVAAMRGGRAVPLVSNAGTPAISDPGFTLVRLCAREGIPVTTVPGPSAVIAGLAVSGLPTDRFTFAGFLPQQAGRRRRELEESLGGGSRASGTLVYYESPKRLLATLRDIAGIAPGRRLAVARELTKLHEELLRGTAAELLDRLDAGGPPRGEIVLMVGPDEAPAPRGGADPETLLRRAMADGLSRRDAAKLVSEATGLPRREVYGVALGIAGEGGE